MLAATFKTHEEYLRFPSTALFAPLGMDSAVLETDPRGTFLTSSFGWAVAQDWAKLGQLFLSDGVVLGTKGSTDDTREACSHTVHCTHTLYTVLIHCAHYTLTIHSLYITIRIISGEAFGRDARDEDAGQRILPEGWVNFSISPTATSRYCRRTYYTTLLSYTMYYHCHDKGTALTIYCTHYALHSLYTELTIYCTHSILNSLYTALTIYCTHYILHSLYTALTL
jgi:hypothetical protein